MSGATIRYISNDVGASVAFYVEHLGFEVEMHPAPGFAAQAWRAPIAAQRARLGWRWSLHV